MNMRLLIAAVVCSLQCALPAAATADRTLENEFRIPKALLEQRQKEGREQSAYFDPLLARLKAEHRRSSASFAATPNRILKCTVHFDIRTDGTLERLVVVKPSGSVEFDKLTLGTVRRCFPTPPPPRSAVPGDRSTFEMTFQNEPDEPPTVHFRLQPKD